MNRYQIIKGEELPVKPLVYERPWKAVENPREVTIELFGKEHRASVVNTSTYSTAQGPRTNIDIEVKVNFSSIDQYWNSSHLTQSEITFYKGNHKFNMFVENVEWVQEDLDESKPGSHLLKISGTVYHGMKGN